MKIIANKDVRFVTDDLREIYISKDEVLRVTYCKQSSKIHIDNSSISIPITQGQLKHYFTLIEDYDKLHFKRFKISLGSLGSLEKQVNNFIQDENIKVENIFEPNVNTVDIYYKCYKGEW